MDSTRKHPNEEWEEKYNTANTLALFFNYSLNLKLKTISARSKWLTLNWSQWKNKHGILLLRIYVCEWAPQMPGICPSWYIYTPHSPMCDSNCNFCKWSSCNMFDVNARSPSLHITFNKPHNVFPFFLFMLNWDASFGI